MSLKVSNIIRKLIFTGSLLGAVSAQAQQDSLFLSVEQLFESGNRVGGTGLIPVPTSHTTVRAVRHTAVP